MSDDLRLLASGRDGDIYEYAPGLVLRKTRDGRSIEHEARVMQYVAERGYPVPAVEEVRAAGSEIVMERIDGPMMMDAMMMRPWTMPRYVTMLGDLHDQLHEIEAPPWLPQLPDNGDRLVHLDLHPMNVMLSARGPVVIDWTNAARGQPLSDVAMTYVLLTCPARACAPGRATSAPARPRSARVGFRPPVPREPRSGRISPPPASRRHSTGTWPSTRSTSASASPLEPAARASTVRA